jgi:hypothetical protein
MKNELESPEDFYTSRWYDFKKSLISKFNLVMILLGIAFLVDWKMGGPFMQKCILFQYKVRGINVNAPNFTILSFFGTYKQIQQLALVYDKFLWIFFLGITALSYLRGFLISALKK